MFGKDVEQFPPILKKVIKEYCISKICDELDCGPSMPCPFGFDILVFNNRIEFAMEKCQHLEKVEEEDLQTILANLGNMHRFGVVHLDINPENIMWSPSKNKPVFIDFGFSDVVREECGFKTLTSFHGTPTYASREMLKLFSLEYKEGYVDLFYNDLICFK